MRELLPEVAPRPDDEVAALLWQRQRSGAWSSKAFNEAAQRTVAEGRALEDAFPHLFAKDDVERPAPKSHFGSARTAAGDLSELVAQWRDDDVLILAQRHHRSRERRPCLRQEVGRAHGGALSDLAAPPPRPVPRPAIEGHVD